MSAAVVNSCDEAGLRAALSGGYSVTFGCDGTIVLTSSLILSNAASIDASGHDVTLSGGGAVRIFKLGSGASLSLKGLKITGGFTQGAGGIPAEEGKGGAILLDHGELHATDCQFTNNTVVGGSGGSGDGAPGAAGRGGAIYSSEGVLRLTNCSFAMNISRGGRGGSSGFVGRNVRGGEAGGAACATFNGDTIAIDCQFIGNQSTGGEGGTYAALGGSPAGTARGGAWQQLGGTSTFSRAVFLTNTAATAAPRFSAGGPDVFGGGLFIESGTSRMDEVVFQGNQVVAGAASRNSPAGFGGGGAIFNSGSVEMRRSRLTGNSAMSGIAERNGQNSGGGGIQNSGWLELRDSLIEANIVRSGVSGGSNGVFFNGLL
jgi:hypothetical protein